jgi:hypothetical protein
MVDAHTDNRTNGCRVEGDRGFLGFIAWRNVGEERLWRVQDCPAGNVVSELPGLSTKT